MRRRPPRAERTAGGSGSLLRGRVGQHVDPVPAPDQLGSDAHHRRKGAAAVDGGHEELFRDHNPLSCPDRTRAHARAHRKS